MLEIWRAIAGIGFNVPARGSRVLYLPDVHSEQSIGFDEAEHPNLDIQTPRLAMVEDIEFRMSDQDVDQINVRFSLRPTDQRGLLEPLVGGLQFEGPLPEGTFVYERQITEADIYRSSCILPRKVYRTLFSENKNVVLMYSDGTYPNLYCGHYALSRGWTDFRKSREIVIGDVLILIKRRGEGVVTIGVRRGQPHRVEGQALVNAVIADTMSALYQVDYYPTGGNPPFVVLARY